MIAPHRYSMRIVEARHKTARGAVRKEGGLFCRADYATVRRAGTVEACVGGRN